MSRTGPPNDPIAQPSVLPVPQHERKASDNIARF
jgi:hypothetical protein